MSAIRYIDSRTDIFIIFKDSNLILKVSILNIR
jgi:hypothetical protein